MRRKACVKWCLFIASHCDFARLPACVGQAGLRVAIGHDHSCHRSQFHPRLLLCSSPVKVRCHSGEEQYAEDVVAALAEHIGQSVFSVYRLQ